MNNSIFELARDCLGLFRDYAQHADEDLEWANLQLGEFLLILRITGACALGRASLEHRLKGHDVIYITIRDLLQVLKETLKDLGGTSEGDVDSPNERKACHEDVQLTLEYLTKIAVALRASGSRERDVRGEAYGEKFASSIKDETREVIRAARLSASFREHRCTEEHQDVPLGLPTAVIDRLVNANARRWGRFAYAGLQDKRRNAMIEAAEAAKPAQAVPPEAVELPSEPQTPPIDPASTTPPPQMEQPEGPTPYLAASKVSSTPTPFDSKVYGEIMQQDFGPVEGADLSKPAGSAVVGKVTLAYPPVPHILEGAARFQCPCCQQMLSHETATETDWRRHVKTDLQPYVCLLADCEQPGQTYFQFKDWIAHMELENKKRPSQWVCGLTAHVSPQTFASPEEYQEHLRKEHPRSASGPSLQILTRRSARPAKELFEQCPFCDWSPWAVADLQNSFEASTDSETLHTDGTRIRTRLDLHRHIAGHLEEISLRALPAEVFDKDDGWDISDDSSSTVQRSKVDVTDEDMYHMRYAVRASSHLTQDYDSELTATNAFDAIKSSAWKSDEDRPISPDGQSLEASWWGVFHQLSTRGVLRTPFLCPTDDSEFTIGRKCLPELADIFRGRDRQFRTGVRCAIIGSASSGQRVALEYARKLHRASGNTGIFHMTVKSSLEENWILEPLAKLSEALWLSQSKDVQKQADAFVDWLHSDGAKGSLLIIDAGAASGIEASNIYLATLEKQLLDRLRTAWQMSVLVVLDSDRPALLPSFQKVYTGIDQILTYAKAGTRISNSYVTLRAMEHSDYSFRLVDSPAFNGYEIDHLCSSEDVAKLLDLSRRSESLEDASDLEATHFSKDIVVNYGFKSSSALSDGPYRPGERVWVKGKPYIVLRADLRETKRVDRVTQDYMYTLKLDHEAQHTIRAMEPLSSPIAEDFERSPVASEAVLKDAVRLPSRERAMLQRPGLLAKPTRLTDDKKVFGIIVKDMADPWGQFFPDPLEEPGLHRFLKMYFGVYFDWGGVRSDSRLSRIGPDVARQVKRLLDPAIRSSDEAARNMVRLDVKAIRYSRFAAENIRNIFSDILWPNKSYREMVMAALTPVGGFRNETGASHNRRHALRREHTGEIYEIPVLTGVTVVWEVEIGIPEETRRVTTTSNGSMQLHVTVTNEPSVASAGATSKRISLEHGVVIAGAYHYICVPMCEVMGGRRPLRFLRRIFRPVRPATKLTTLTTDTGTSEPCPTCEREMERTKDGDGAEWYQKAWLELVTSGVVLDASS